SVPHGLCWLFFSSRRRHTRFSRDWSSDVCSSDLLNLADLHNQLGEDYVLLLRLHPALNQQFKNPFSDFVINVSEYDSIETLLVRSEERRVGKECRSRRSQSDRKKEEVTNRA